MFETPMTVVGRIITDMRRRVVGGQEVISFRVASNSRRKTADGSWEQGNSLFITVNCWGKLVTGVGAALYKGAPVIAVGTVHTSDYEDRDGVPRSTLEMRATSVGPDLSRVIARVEQRQHPQNLLAGPVNGADSDDKNPDAKSDIDGRYGLAHGEEPDALSEALSDGLVEQEDLSLSI